MSEETKEILNKLLEYFKESNINDFGYEQDKLISYKEAQILLDYITNLQQKVEQKDKEIDRLNNIIKIMENYLELIYDLGYDHDGLETTGDLMNLMDELVRYASLGRAYNITEPIYENSGKKYNILHEELKENNK